VVDRAKDVIIRGGYNVASAEVEAAVYDVADVAECAVVGVPTRSSARTSPWSSGSATGVGDHARRPARSSGPARGLQAAPRPRPHVGAAPNAAGKLDKATLAVLASERDGTG
jgi:acyl-CoA synthetase (AMP-forming)/AMP-acid ligase II